MTTKPTTYVILLPGDEDAWEQSSDEHKAAVFAKHDEFSTLLEKRGHTVVGGHELSHSRGARVVRRQPDGSLEVTEGPYAETVEQLSGYYVVESSDLDDLIEVVGVLADAEGGIEVRAAIDHSGDEA